MVNFKRTSCVVALVGTLVQPASASVTVFDLAAPGDVWSAAISVNNNGQVTGTAYLQTANLQPFLWDNGQLTLLGQNDGITFAAGAISSTGQIVGYGHQGSPLGQAFLWQNGVANALPNSEAYTLLTGNDINDSGAIVGQALGASNTEAYMFQGGVITGLGTLGGGWSNGVAINGVGQIVGYSENRNGDEEPFIWQNGVMEMSGNVGKCRKCRDSFAFLAS